MISSVVFLTSGLFHFIFILCKFPCKKNLCCYCHNWINLNVLPWQHQHVSDHFCIVPALRICLSVSLHMPFLHSFNAVTEFLERADLHLLPRRLNSERHSLAITLGAMLRRNNPHHDCCNVQYMMNGYVGHFRGFSWWCC